MQYEMILNEVAVDGLMREEAAARRDAAQALWRAEEDRQNALACWSVPDPEEESILSAAAAMARRTLGAPIAGAALAGSRSGVILPAGGGAPQMLSIDDPVMRLMRGMDDALAMPDARADPRMAGSAFLTPGIGARTMLIVPIRLHGGPAIGLLAAAAQCEASVSDQQRRELIRLAERTAEEVLARYTARTDPATGALSVAGLRATLGREARRRAMHDRPAALAVLALSRTLGAPRAFDENAYRCADEQALAGETWLVDNDRLPPQILRVVAQETLGALRESDVIASVPTPTADLQMDAALDTPCLPQTEGPTCLALLMPETTAAQALTCVRRIQAWLASVALPGAPGRHICAIAGVTEIEPDMTGDKPAAYAAMNRVYRAVDIARRDRLSAALVPAPA